MITFVDTNVLLDVFLPDPEWGSKSKENLEIAFNQGALIVNEIIYSELSPQFPDKEMLEDALRQLSIRMVSLDLEVAYQAGKKWQQYRKTVGKRNRVLADFLIGAHAAMRSEKLLTRDRGFYKTYFKELDIQYE
jgi:predicted nucleic acid-binding protein